MECFLKINKKLCISCINVLLQINNPHYFTNFLSPWTETLAYVLFSFFLLLSFFSHLPIAPLCSDIDWRRNSTLVQRSYLLAEKMSPRQCTDRDKHVNILTPDNFAFSPLQCYIICTEINRLIIFPQCLHWCVLSPKGQHILLIEGSHARERKRVGLTHGDKF